MNKGDAQPGVHVQNTQITQKTAVHEQNADFAFRTASSPALGKRPRASVHDGGGDASHESASAK
jgi:hypothetical protein